MKKLLQTILLGAALLVPGHAAATCKLALALGLDISSSVDPEEYRLQIHGLADALASKEVTDAILTPEGAHIAAALYEWSGYPQQDIIIGWSILDSPETIQRFARRMKAHPRPYWDFATAVGKGVEFGAKLLDEAPVCARNVLDISGDGVNNLGVNPSYFYELGRMNGRTVNAVVIRGADPDPVDYYRREVIWGPGAFVAVAEDFEDYLSVIKSKLLREISVEMVLGGK